MRSLRRFSRATLYASVIAGAMVLPDNSARGHTTLVLPNGGEVLEAGSVYTVEWRQDVAHNVENWDLWYSTAGAGGPWIELAMDLPDASGRTYEWTIPDAPSNQVRVRVRQDNPGTDYEDISDGDFTIEPAVVPAVSGWGFAVMTLLVAAAGTVALSRRVTLRDAGAGNH